MADIYQNNLNKYIKDGARSSKFEICITPPKEVKLPISITPDTTSNAELSDTDLSRALIYFCYAGGFPGITSEVAEFKYRGKTIPIPIISNPNQSWSATFYNDENHGIRKMFKDWIDLTYPYGYSETIQPRRLTQESNAIIYQYNYELKRKTTACKLHGIFPVTMSDIEVSFENMNQVESFQVEFRFGYFDYIDISSGLSADEVKAMVKSAVNDTINYAVQGVKNIGTGFVEGLTGGFNFDDWVSNNLKKFVGSK